MNEIGTTDEGMEVYQTNITLITVLHFNPKDWHIWLRTGPFYSIFHLKILFISISLQRNRLTRFKNFEEKPSNP